MANKIMLGGNIFSYALTKKETKFLLDFALDHGCAAVDTADVYSNGKSEQFLGSAIENRKNWFIASKIGVHSGQKIERINTKKNIFIRIEESLKRLKTDYIDLYQLHHFDKTVPIEETFDALEELKKEGKIIEYGVSNFSPKEISSIENNHLKGLYSNQVHFNLINNEAETLFKEYYNKGLKLIAYNVLARGVLRNDFLNLDFKSFRSEKSISVNEDINEELRLILLEMQSISSRHKINIAQLAFEYANDQEFINKVIVGVRTTEQLKNFIDINKSSSKVEWMDLLKQISKITQRNNFDLGSYNFYKNLKD
jgi:aryl-alcohol dehydrogenase-like predicted oxidoreductase